MGYIIRATLPGRRKATSVVVAGGKTSPDASRALVFDGIRDAEESARFMRQSYPQTSFKIVYKKTS